MPLLVNGEVVPDRLIEEEQARMKAHPEAANLDSERLRRWAEETVIERIVLGQAAVRGGAVPQDFLEFCLGGPQRVSCMRSKHLR